MSDATWARHIELRLDKDAYVFKIDGTDFPWEVRRITQTIDSDQVPYITLEIDAESIEVSHTIRRHKEDA